MRPIAPIRLALLATLVAAGPALAGPPWISIEYPANPYDAATRGALLTLHTYHHGIPMDGVVSARAEGLVGGVRRSIGLVVRATGRPGVWAVSGDLPAGGTWVISSTLGDQETGGRASALLALGSDGRVAGLSVPVEHRGQWIVPREATAADVDAMLRGAVASVGAPARTGSAGAGGAVTLAGMGLLLLLPVLARRRRQNPAAQGLD